MKLIKYGESSQQPNAYLTGDSWANAPLAGADTETTGLDPTTARIVSLGMVIEPDIDREWIVYPDGYEIPLPCTAVHGISTEFARQHGQPLKDVLTEFRAILDSLPAGSPLVMVNAPYDITIWDREFKRCGMPGIDLDTFPPIVDTLTCDRSLDTYRAGKRTLTATCAAYSLAVKGAHTSLGDIHAAIGLARAMARKYPLLANCSLAVLQERQAAKHREWAEHYEDYQRTGGNPDFICSRHWPLIPEGNTKW